MTPTTEHYFGYVGDKGWMASGGSGGGFQLRRYEKISELPRPEKTPPRAHRGPDGDLLYCMKNGGTPCSDFVTSAGPLASFALSGHLAMLSGVGKKIEWDMEKLQRKGTGAALCVMPAPRPVYRFRRQPQKTRPSTPAPSSASVDGSGTVGPPVTSSSL